MLRLSWQIYRTARKSAPVRARAADTPALAGPLCQNSDRLLPTPAAPPTAPGPPTAWKTPPERPVRGKPLACYTGRSIELADPLNLACERVARCGDAQRTRAPLIAQ